MGLDMALIQANQQIQKYHLILPLWRCTYLISRGVFHLTYFDEQTNVDAISLLGCC